MQGSKRAIVTLSCLLLTSLAATPANSGETGGDSAEQAIAAALSGDHRVATESARDIYRHPQATLLFFGLQPGMIVVEMWPGGGWYTAILAPALGAEGRLIAAEEQHIRCARRSPADWLRCSCGGSVRHLLQNEY